MASMDSTIVDFGMNLLEPEIDQVIFQTNEFLTNSNNISTSGAFWWILQISMALAALFSILFAAGLAYKMMVKNESLDVMKLFRPLAISFVLCFWYPPAGTGRFGGSSSWCALDFLSFVPNAIGSYTHDLYEAETVQISDQFRRMEQLMYERDTLYQSMQAKASVTSEGLSNNEMVDVSLRTGGAETAINNQTMAKSFFIKTLTSGLIIGLDKIIMFLALLVYRIGWWSTIYCQQILLGMLTIFGPIQWAFSILPKWEGAWAKWITRYLTVHFYGAALYFVGFYVLLLFDICLSIQIDNLTSIVSTAATTSAYIQNAFVTSAYMLVASIVSLKCLNFVPDLAAWMIPEGEVSFSTRGFAEGVAGQAKAMATSAAGHVI